MLGHLIASLMAFIWPKAFFDFVTSEMDILVSPVPFLQVINLFLAVLVLLWEWPVQIIASSSIQQSLLCRLVFLPLVSVISCLIYQGGDVAIYYIISVIVYWWAYANGERVCNVE
jgi:hypothetical protein